MSQSACMYLVLHLVWYLVCILYECLNDMKTYAYWSTTRCQGSLFFTFTVWYAYLHIVHGAQAPGLIHLSNQGRHWSWEALLTSTHNKTNSITSYKARLSHPSSKTTLPPKQALLIKPNTQSQHRVQYSSCSRQLFRHSKNYESVPSPILPGRQPRILDHCSSAAPTSVIFGVHESIVDERDESYARRNGRVVQRNAVRR